MANEDLKQAQDIQQQAPFVTNQQQRILVATAQMQQIQSGQLATEGDSVKHVPTVIGEQYLVFSLYDQEFAVKAALVQSVERPMYITPVPNVVSWVRGVVNLRGSIASVVDLRAFLGLEEVANSSRTRVLSLQSNEMVICLTVDSVSEMLLIPQVNIKSEGVRQTSIPRWIASYATSYALVGNRVIVLLDVAHLLFSDKMLRY
ncbi:MAG: hypothetical protein NVS4B1_00590 [Ktedonobacteraceae bacterium]